MNILKKIKRFLQKSKVKILCCLTIVSILLGMFTVFSSANTVSGDDNILKPYNVYFPYPNFSGFSFNYTVPNDFGGTYEGRVYNTSDFIYGFNSGSFDPTDPALDIQWQDGFYFNYPNLSLSGEGLTGNIIELTSRLQSFMPQGNSSAEPGDIIRWSNLLWSSYVKKYITGDSLTFYYDDYVVSRDTSWFATPYCAISRCIPEQNFDPGSFDYNISHRLEYVAFNNFTGESTISTYSYTDTSKTFPTSYEGSSANYFYFNLTPYNFFTDYFANNPNVDYIYIKSSTCNLRVYDTLGSTQGSYFTHVNIYNYLLTDAAASKFKLNVSDYIDNIRGIKDVDEKFLAKDFTDWISNAVKGIMSFEILPGFSFGLIFMVLVGALMFFFFLRLFSGG